MDRTPNISATCWQRLPPELLELIPRFLISQSDMDAAQKNIYKMHRLKALISRCSMVCRSWALTLRPLLFENEITLRNTAHMQVIHAMSQSLTSGWLCPYITTVTFLQHEIQAGFWERPLQKTAVWRLTNVSKLRFIGRDVADHSGSTPLMFPWMERVFLRLQPSLSAIELHNFRFPSLTALLRVAANIPLLRKILLQEIQWTESDFEVTQADFARLGKLWCQKAYIIFCTNNTVLAWIIVPGFLHHISSISTLQAGRAIIGLITTLYKENEGTIITLKNDSGGKQYLGLQ